MTTPSEAPYIVIPDSLLANGRWQDARWFVKVINDHGGTILLTAVAGDNTAMVCLTTDDVSRLRQLPAYHQANARRDAPTNPPNPSNPSTDCYDCRTLTERVANIEHHLDDDAATFGQIAQRIAALQERLLKLDNYATGAEHALASRIAYLERKAQGITGPDAGL